MFPFSLNSPRMNPILKKKHIPQKKILKKKESKIEPEPPLQGKRHSNTDGMKFEMGSMMEDWRLESNKQLIGYSL